MEVVQESLCAAAPGCNLVVRCAGPPCTSEAGHKPGECWLRRWTGEGEYPHGIPYIRGVETFFKMWTRFDCKQGGEPCNPAGTHNPCCYEVFAEPFCTNWGLDEQPKCWAGDRRRLAASFV